MHGSLERYGSREASFNGFSRPRLTRRKRVRTGRRDYRSIEFLACTAASAVAALPGCTDRAMTSSQTRQRTTRPVYRASDCASSSPDAERIPSGRLGGDALRQIPIITTHARMRAPSAVETPFFVEDLVARTNEALDEEGAERTEGDEGQAEQNERRREAARRGERQGGSREVGEESDRRCFGRLGGR